MLSEEGSYDPTPIPFSNENRPTEDQIADLAKFYGCAKSDICIICGKKIVLQIFRNSGVCCEKHRKDRDNDHEPFRGGALAP
jgi:hypothetical protein